MHDYSTLKSRWTALVNRDPAAANAFVYCVTTTKIYCRPNCPSRLARRANVIFKDTAAAASASGYRACMRCRPAVAEDEGDPQKIAVAKTCASIDKEDQGGEKKSVKELAKDAGFTESHFCRVFKKVTGMTVGEYRASGSGKKNATTMAATSGTESRGIHQNSGFSNTPYEFDFNSPLPLDDQDQTQLEFELASGWYDFSSPPDTYAASFDMVTEIPYGKLLNDWYSNSESSINTTPHARPLMTPDDDLQFLNLDHQFAHVI